MQVKVADRHLQVGAVLSKSNKRCVRQSEHVIRRQRCQFRTGGGNRAQAAVCDVTAQADAELAQISKVGRRRNQPVIRNPHAVHAQGFQFRQARSESFQQRFFLHSPALHYLQPPAPPTPPPGACAFPLESADVLLAQDYGRTSTCHPIRQMRTTCNVRACLSKIVQQNFHK